MMWMEAGDCYIPDIKELKECSSKADLKEPPPSSSNDSSKDDANSRGPRKSVTNYIKIVPFTIESANERDAVLLSIRSNLANQILIFADKELSMRAENLLLPPKVAGDKAPELTVFVCILAPVEKKEGSVGSKTNSSRTDDMASRTDEKASRTDDIAKRFGTTSLWGEYNKGITRELIVGITVDVLDAESKESIVQQGFQMKGRIGKSIVGLGSKSIDLGCSRYTCSRTIGQTLTGSLLVTNHSENLPLTFEIRAPPSITLTRTSGVQHFYFFKKKSAHRLLAHSRAPQACFRELRVSAIEGGALHFFLFFSKKTPQACFRGGKGAKSKVLPTSFCLFRYIR